MHAKFYVGARIAIGEPYRQTRHVFTASTVPTSASHGTRYIYVIGPFRTQTGADFMATYGANNPHCQSVDDAAERLANPKHATFKETATGRNRQTERAFQREQTR